MTEQDKTIIDNQPNEILGNWYNSLNTWEWPIALPNPEPSTYVPNGRRSQIMDYIEGEIGSKACLQWVWENILYKGTYSSQAFEDWWTEHHVLSLPLIPVMEPRRGKVNTKINVVCTCGASAVHSNQHSVWCDRY